uniref:Death domain-containing protein n=1 Tax=Branchiostoma floridae TaxID=7739 RepID=C3ZU21_BRAFL|eukprot:XP_002587896.1 hypothetical protein BRAFLDRAFT_87284 [Branchiostoma floridae]
MAGPVRERVTAADRRHFDFMETLLRISDELTEEETKNVKLFCRHLIPRGQAEQLDRAVDVFNKLIDLDKIDQENLDFLEEILERIGRLDLIRDVLRRFQPPDRVVPENPELQPPDREDPENPELQPPHREIPENPELQPENPELRPENQDPQRSQSNTEGANEEGNATSNIYVVVHGRIRMIQETLHHLKNRLATLSSARRSQVKFRGYKKHKSILVHFSIPRANTAVLRHMADHSDPRLVYMGVKSLQIDAEVPIKVQQGAPLYDIKRQLPVDDIEVGCSTRTRHQRAPQSWTRLSALNLFSDALPLHLQAAASLEYQGFSYSLVRALVQKDRLREHQMRQAIQNLRNAEQQFGGKGSGEGQLTGPAGICTNSSGHILVADSGNERIQIFTRLSSYFYLFPSVSMAGPVRESRVTDADRRHFDFVQTLRRISDELTEEETATMKLFCLHLIPREQRSQLKRIVDVFHKLMELDKIDQENLEFIEEILERIGRQDLIRDVLREFQPETPELQPGTGLKGTTAEGDVHFDDVIKDVSHKWDDLAWKLGFQDNEIKVIRDLERDHDRRCREMLTRWRNREGSGATLQVLIQALKNIGETRTAESLEGPTTSNTYVVVHGTVRMIQETLDHLKNCLATLIGTRRSQVKFRGYKKHRSILVHFSIPRQNTAVLRHMADHSDPRLVYMGVKSLQIDAEVPIKVQQGAPLYVIKRQLPVDDIEVGCSTRDKHQKAPQSWTRLSALNLFSDALPLHLQAAASLEYQGFSYSLVRALVQKDRLREHQMRQATQNLRNAEVDSNTLRQKAEVDSNTLRQKAEVDSNTIMALRSKLKITENRLKEALETISVLEEKLQQAQEYAEKAAKQLASHETEHRGEKPPGGWPQEYRGEKPPGGWPQEYRGEKPPGGWPQEYRGEKPPGETLQEYRGEKPPGGWLSQVEKADSATQTHLTDPFGTTGRPGDVGGDKVGADPTVKEEVGKPPRQDSGSGSDGRVEVLGTEAPEQERHTAGTEGTASGSTEDRKQDVITFGGMGSEPGKFWSPRGVVVSPSNEIFVTDLYNRRVQVHSTEGVYLRHFPTAVPGTEDNVMEPHDVCMDGNGTLWVVGQRETADHVVQYSTDGTAMARFDLEKIGYLRGIAVDMRTNYILVIDCDQGEVHVFRPDGSLVRTVRHPRAGEMTRPTYAKVDGEGNILVSDWDTHCVYVYDESGKFLFQFGGEGSGEGQLKYPRGISTDSTGYIVVAEHDNRRIQIFTRHGEFVRTVHTGFRPEGLAVGPEGQLVVTSRWNHTVTVFPNY